jgi:DMSO reductase anchor subunit
MSLGVLASTVALGGRDFGSGAVAAAAGTVALVVSTLHLGRPAAAWKALRNVRRYWLSREVALFSGFAAATFAYVGASGFVHPAAAADSLWGVLAVLLGGAGVFASGRLYLVPARPVWNSPRTVVAFFATASAIGPLVAVLFAHPLAASARLLLGAAAAGSLLQLAVVQHLAASMAVRKEREFSITARLLFGHFRSLFVLRVVAGMAAVGVCGLAALSGTHPGLWAGVGLVLAAAAESIGRYLFFVTVTPMTAARRFASGSR